MGLLGLTFVGRKIRLIPGSAGENVENRQGPVSYTRRDPRSWLHEVANILFW
jgi:hypothetical protein